MSLAAPNSKSKKMRSFLRRLSAVGNSAPSSKVAGFPSLVASEDWSAARKFLSTDSGILAAREELSSAPELGTPLQYICRFRPPVDVVRTVAEHVFPGSPSQADAMERYPLHIASKWGASSQVIQYLVKEYPDAANHIDVVGKTPMHLLCESYSAKFRPSDEYEGNSPMESEHPLRDNMLEAVLCLCKVAPSSVNTEDLADMTALEYAIENDLDIKVVSSIQKLSESEWKRRFETNEDQNTKMPRVSSRRSLEGKRIAPPSRVSRTA